MKKHILFVLFPLFLTPFFAQASMKVMFHPHDPTLEEIAQVFAHSEHSAQVVLYNIDVTPKNPVIRYLQSSEFKRKLANGFTAQMIFEGYATVEENQARMQALEDLGIDVRFLGAEQKVHHKFALFDAGFPDEVLVTGSANWSLSSMNNYDENIMFLEQEFGITSQFSGEFVLLWAHAKEFGETRFPNAEALAPAPLKGDLHAFFNSQNYTWSSEGFKKTSTAHLTRTLVAAMDRAQSSLEIATTRIKLAPVYEALKRAAARGVHIKIVVSQAEYVPEKQREKATAKDCGDDLYNPECSSGVNFSPLLDSAVSGFENMQIRLKFFNLKLADNISQQMHNKYMIVDGRWILSGSFNWSNSSEWGHIENIVAIDGETHRAALQSFENNFDYLWNMNRQNLSSFSADTCSVPPTVLSFHEIDEWRGQAWDHGLRCDRGSKPTAP